MHTNDTVTAIFYLHVSCFTFTDVPSVQSKTSLPPKGIFPAEWMELLQNQYKYQIFNNNRFHLKRKRGSPKAFFPMFTVPMRNQSHLTPLNIWQ